MCSTTFFDLPLELQLMIFSYLGPEDRLRHAALVCSKWQEVAEHPMLWQEVTLDRGSVSEEGLLRIMTKFSLLKKMVLVNFSECGQELDDVSIPASLQVTDMDRVKLDRCKGFKLSEMQHGFPSRSMQLDGIIDMKCLLPSGTPVKVYILHFTPYPPGELQPFLGFQEYMSIDSYQLGGRFVIGTWNVRSVQRGIEVQTLLAAINRRNLILLEADRIYQDHTFELLAGCKNLKVLQLRDLYPHNISENNLINRIGTLRNLRTLTLNFSCLGDGTEFSASPSASTFQAFFSERRFPHLECLKIQEAPHLDNTFVSQIVSCYPSLAMMAFHRTRITRGFIDIITQCETLRYLSLEGRYEEEDGLTWDDLEMLAEMKDELAVTFKYGNATVQYGDIHMNVTREC